MSTTWITPAIVIDIIKTLLTLFVACIAARIAWRQAKTQEYKVKLDLFERRMKIYDAVREALMMIYRDGKISNEQNLEEHSLLNWKIEFFLITPHLFALRCRRSPARWPEPNAGGV